MAESLGRELFPVNVERLVRHDGGRTGRGIVGIADQNLSIYTACLSRRQVW
jgi:hypothetical protein